ncbi:MAG: hypothetical protein R3B90_00130 [Planctomycetaceae bacterium]
MHRRKPAGDGKPVVLDCLDDGQQIILRKRDFVAIVFAIGELLDDVPVQVRVLSPVTEAVAFADETWLVVFLSCEAAFSGEVHV